MDDDSDVVHLGVQLVDLLDQLPLDLERGAGGEFPLQFLFVVLSALYFLGLGIDFFPGYLSVHFIEVLVQIIFDKYESHCEVVPSVVLDVIFIEMIHQAILGQVVLHQLVVGLAVVLVPDPLFNNSRRG